MNQTKHILKLASNQQILSAADVRKHGCSPQLLLGMYKAGKLQRLARGIYCLPDMQITEHQVVMEVCQRVPKAVLCLLTALQFHDIGTQSPHEVWIAMPEGAQSPTLDYPLLRITRLRGAAYSEGIETVVKQGVAIRTYSAAKTVTDCFKFRNKIGLEVAIEALKDAWRKRKISMDEVSYYAKINRVEKVIQPYLETVVL